MTKNSLESLLSMGSFYWSLRPDNEMRLRTPVGFDHSGYSVTESEKPINACESPSPSFSSMISVSPTSPKQGFIDWKRSLSAFETVFLELHDAPHDVERLLY